MTPEDRLRRLLQEEDEIVPAGDGFVRIRERLDAHRSLRSRLLVPTAALVGLVAVATAAVFGVAATDDGGLRPKPATPASPEPEPAPTSTACHGGLCPEPKPLPSLPTTGVTTSGDGVPVWPFTTDTQAADWGQTPRARTWAADPVQVVQHLLDDFLKLPGGTAFGTAGGRGDVVPVVVKVGGRAVSTVRVEQVGRDTTGPWSVTGAVAEDAGITSPKSGAAVDSPLTVTGRVTGYDESVHVQLLASSGASLADGHAPAGAEQPWSHSLRWTSDAWSVAAVVASTFDGKGDLHAIGLTAVVRGGSGPPGVPASGSTLVAVEDRHVVLADTLTGTTLRQLSYPPTDATDSEPGRGGEDGVVWVRTRADGCTSSIIRAGLAHGPAGVTVDARPRHLRLPSLSDGGRSLGWVESGCGDGAAETVVVRGPDAKPLTVAAAPGHVTGLDVRDDGSALVGLPDRVFLLPAGAGSLASARPLAAGPGCTVTAPAWDEAVVTAWERCPDGFRLTRYAATGPATSSSGAVPTDPAVVRMTVADGFVLVVLADGTPARFSDGRLNPVPDGKRLSQAAW